MTLIFWNNTKQMSFSWVLRNSKLRNRDAYVYTVSTNIAADPKCAKMALLAVVKKACGNNDV